jgi:hypothetical protein
MRNQWFVMSYSKSLGCWLVIKGEVGYMMYCGESFNLRVSKTQGIPCRLELSGKQWYVVLGAEGIKLSLRSKEVYEISI